MKRILYLLLIISLLLSAFIADKSRTSYTIKKDAEYLFSHDVGNDGDIDLLMALSNMGLQILDNDGSGYFSESDLHSFGSYPFHHGYGMCLGQLDDDPEYDLVYRARYTDDELNLWVYFNHFSDSTHLDLNGIIYLKLDICDMNNDGLNDIIATFPRKAHFGIFYNQGNHTFSEMDYIPLTNFPSRLTCGDINGDHLNDIVVFTGIATGTEGGFNSVLYNNGDSTFTRQYLNTTADNKYEIIDFDRDGRMDVVCMKASHFMPFSCLIDIFEFDPIKDSLVHAKKIILDNFAEDLLITDMNNDGFPDIVSVSKIIDGKDKEKSLHNRIIVYLNKGNFELEAPKSIYIGYHYDEYIRRITCGDYNNDGYTDIAVVRRAFNITPNLEVVFNDGTGGLTIATEDQKPIATSTHLSCYPNPNNGNITISFNLQQSADVYVTITDNHGKMIHQTTTTHKNIGEQNIPLNLSHLPNGIYFYSLTINGKETTCKKLVITK